MAVDYTTTRLIDSVERRAGFPTRQGLYTEQDFIDFMNEAMYQEVVPEIMRVREEFFLTSTEYDIVSGQADYAIPSMAIGQKVRSVELFDPNDPYGTNFVVIGRADIEALGSRVGPGSSTTVYYMNGNNITLYPTPQSTGTDVKLRIRYFRKPAELVTPNEGAVINAIDTGTGVVSLASIPVGWSTASVLDFTRGVAPFSVVAEAVTPSNVSGTDITVDLTTAALLQEGDTVALAGYSIVPQIAMPEAHRLLEEACVMNVLEGIDDSDGLARASTRFVRYLENLRTMITPRDDAGMRKIVARDDLYAEAGSGRGLNY
jgi:hypothetical protein